MERSTQMHRLDLFIYLFMKREEMQKFFYGECIPLKTIMTWPTIQKHQIIHACQTLVLYTCIQPCHVWPPLMHHFMCIGPTSLQPSKAHHKLLNSNGGPKRGYMKKYRKKERSGWDLREIKRVFMENDA